MKIFGIKIPGIRADSSTYGSGKSWVESTAAGGPVSPAKALQLSTVYACVRLIASTLAQLPLALYEVDRGTGRRERLVDSDFNRLWNLTPHPMWSGVAFWEWVVVETLLRGDAFVSVERDGSRRANRLTPLDGSLVKVKTEGNYRTYEVSVPDGEYGGGRIISLQQFNVLHFTGFGQQDRDGRTVPVLKSGISSALKLATEMEAFVRSFYANGTMSQFVLKRSKAWSAEERAAVEKEFQKRYSQGASTRHVPMVISADTELERISDNLTGSQLLESRTFQAEDIARAFGCPAFLVGFPQKQTALGSGLAEITASFHRFTIAPIAARFAAEVNRKLYLYSSRLAEFDTDALLRATRNDRYSAHAIALGTGAAPAFMTVNEVRAVEGLPPVEGGDDLYRGANVGAEPPPDDEPEPPPDDDDEE